MELKKVQTDCGKNMNTYLVVADTIVFCVTISEVEKFRWQKICSIMLKDLVH